jgi:hypothetical protein
MKLFVWKGDGVLTDYASGMVVAIASDLEGAHRVIHAADHIATGSYPALPTETIDLGDACTASPVAWVCWGGG